MVTIIIDELGMSTIYSARFEDILDKVSSETENLIVYSILPEQYKDINDVDDMSKLGTISMFQKNGKKILEINNIKQELQSDKISCLNSDKFNKEFNGLNIESSLKLYTPMTKQEINSIIINEYIDKCSNELLHSSLDDIVDYDYELLESLTKISSKTLKKSRH